MSLATILLFPTRVKGSGTLTIAAGTTETFSGMDQKAQRRQIVVSNLSATDILKLKDNSGRIFGTVQPGSHYTLETTDSIGVYNPNAGDVQCEVAELFLDPGVSAGSLSDLGAIGAYPSIGGSSTMPSYTGGSVGGSPAPSGSYGGNVRER